MTNDQQVESTVWIPVPPEEAFRLVTDPRRLRRWLIVAGTLDVRVGGEVHLVVAPGAHAVGRVTHARANRRFVYTHGWLGDEDLPPGSSTVEVSLEPENDGTRVTVRHGGLPAGYADMADGWNDFLARLVRAVAGEHNAHDWDPEGEIGSDAAVLESSLYTLLSSFRRLEAWPGDRPTGSTSFTVDGLAHHLVENARWLGSILDPGLAATDGDAHTLDVGSPRLEDDVADALWPVVRHLVEREPSEVVDLGQPVPVGTVVKYLSVEFLVHAWDLTHAADVELDASPALIGAVLRNCQDTRDSVFFAADNYEAPRPVDSDDPLDQLLGQTGRSR